jgi:hypothetical protein
MTFQTNTVSIVKHNHGVFWWIMVGWWYRSCWWVLIGWWYRWILKKGTTVRSTVTALCQECGHSELKKK